MRDFTEEEKQAIKDLERSFSKCNRLGLKFVGMDDSLLCMHGEAVDAAENDVAGCRSVGGYRPIACVVRLYEKGHTRVRAKSYIDSGGW